MDSWHERAVYLKPQIHAMNAGLYGERSVQAKRFNAERAEKTRRAAEEVDEM